MGKVEYTADAFREVSKRVCLPKKDGNKMRTEEYYFIEATGATVRVTIGDGDCLNACMYGGWSGNIELVGSGSGSGHRFGVDWDVQSFQRHLLCRSV